MNTANETRHEDFREERKDAGRTGQRSFNKEGYIRRDDKRPSYNRENSNNRGGARSYGDRPQRPSFNKYGDRPQRPEYNRNASAGGDRPSYNKGGGDRPQRPEYNRNAPAGGDRPSYNRGGGDRPQRSFNTQDDKPWRNNSNNNEERKPWQNNRGGEAGERPRFERPRIGGGYGNSPSDNRGGERRERPRFQSGDDKPREFSRPVRRTADYDSNAKYSKKKQLEYKAKFTDPNEPIRLNKYLANAGICSRREADEFITAGVVTVNGVVVSELGTKIKRDDLVKFHDESVDIEKKVYVLLNKPKDCVTTTDDPHARLTVLDLVKNACRERIYPVGRLDRNTTGVLLLTNDGDLASKLTHPKFLKKKIYHIFTDKNVVKSDMEKIASGIQLEDGEIRADEISYTDDERRDQVGIEIHSGKNRIVRRIFESLGYKVMRLDRVYFAGLTKKGLRRGEWRYLTEREVSFLKMGAFE